MDKVRVSSKYQIVIPRQVREKLKIRKGQEFFVIEQGLGFLAIPDVDIAELEGAIPGLPLDGFREETDRF
jgi:AbrB family looped-hinge helix DNA binding protein